jgi:uncharacterized protein involved in exopolysaccharide biosynthesis
MNKSLQKNPGNGVSPFGNQAIIKTVNKVHEPSLLDYWLILAKYKWSILFFIITGMLAAVLLINSMTPQYRSKARLLVEPITQNKQTSLGAYEYVDSPRLFYQTQYEIITSRNIAKQVIKNLGLQNDKRFLASFDEMDELAPADSPFPIKNISENMRLEPFVDLLLTDLRVSGGNDSQIFDIEYDATDPVLASEIANALADAYINFGASSRGKGAAHTTDWLTKQDKKLRLKLEKSEIALQEFKSEHSMLDTGSNLEVSNTKLSALAKQLIIAQSDRSDAEVRYHQIKAISEQNGDLNSISSILNNEVIVKLKEAEIDQAREVSELAQRYGSNHPKLITAKTKLQKAQNTISNVVNEIVANLSKEVSLTKARERKLRGLIGREETSARNLQSKGFQLGKLEQKLAYHRRMYEEFLAKASEIESKTNFSISNITILDPAHPVFKPYSPNIKRIFILCTVIGAFIGILFAFLRK